MSEAEGPLAEVYAALRAQDWDGARTACGHLLGDADDAYVRHALGLACCGAGDFAEAVQHLAHAARLAPETYRFARDTAAVLAVLGHWTPVLETLAPWVDALTPDDARLYLAAVTRTATGPHLDTLMSRRAWLDDAAPALRLSCADALLACGRLREAQEMIAGLDQATLDTPDALGVQARLFDATGQPDPALACHVRRAARLPASGRTRLQLALALQNRGRADDSRTARLEAVALGLDQASDRSTCLYLMLGDPEVTSSMLLEAARKVFDATPHVSSARPRHRSANARLRVGYISAEFRSTPSFHFTSSFLAAHDRTTVETFLYNCCAHDDGATEAYARLGEHWRHVGRASSAEVRDTILRDQLDILVDLSGHFPGNRLTLFCERLAPVQASYPHFPGTTGCPGMDVLFTDAWTSPAGTDDEYSEPLCRLPGGYLAYTPAVELPPVAPGRRGPATFGMFQRLAKLNPGAWDAFAGVLHAVPGSRLLVHNGDASLDQPDSATVRQLRHELGARDVDPARLVPRGPLPMTQHLIMMASADVTLDTFPYAGQTTTVEALLMGVPVITLTQATHVSRVGAALLARAGRGSWAVRSVSAYVDTAARAVEQARSRPEAAAELRRTALAAGLTDGRRLARDLEAAYQSLAR